MNIASEPRWWVAISQKTQGPFSAAELASLVKNQKIGLQTMACPLDGQAWQPIAQIKQLATLFPTQIPASAPILQTTNPYEATSLPQASPSLALPQPTVGVSLVVAYFCLFWTPIYRGIAIVIDLSNVEGIATDLPTELFFLHFLIAKVLIFILIGILGILAGLAWKNQQRRAVWLTCSFIALNGLMQWTVIWIIRMYIAAVTEFVENPGAEFAVQSSGGVQRFLLILDIANLLLELAILVWIIGWGRKQSWND